jgi:hypothetical protein
MILARWISKVTTAIPNPAMTDPGSPSREWGAPTEEEEE